MKTILSLLVFWCGLISAPAASGEVPEALPNLDRRAEHAAAAGALAPAFSNTARAAREEKTRSLGEQFPRLHIATDPVTKAAKWVAASDRFLSGPKGAGGAVGNAAAALPVDDPYRAVKAFLNEYRGLFGHDAALLADTQILRDDTTPRSGLRTTVWQQFVDGIPIFEGMLKASLGKGGELVNVGSQLVAAPALAADLGTPDRAVVQRSPRVAARQAVVLAARNVGTELDADAVTPTDEPEGARLLQHFAAPGLLEPRATLVWLPMNELAMRLCWSVILTSKARGEMFRVVVDAETGEIQIRQGLTNYISDASYRVFTSDSPSPMSPGPAVPGSTQPAVVARPLVTTPALNTTASPNGWIDDGVNETRGNNVDAHLDLNADNIADTPRPQGAAGRVFDFALDLTQAPATYRDAAVTNLFYWCNRIHDRFYELGFTEAAGNFQNNTFGRGGVGNDAVQADAQDGSGTNNANFSTPPDGAAGRMQMYVFTGPTPDRDGDFDHEIVIHEYTHGLSNRLVGGGVGISALQPRGMGEGWSDFYGLCLLSEAGDDVDGNYAAGGYATYQLTAGFDQNYYYGIRRYPYTTDLAKNPLTFKDIDPAQASAHTGVPRSPAIGNTANEVHNMGEVWCVALWDARANLIRKLGFALGNELILQLVTDGMKLAPANPTFLQARDAILQAELVATGGAHRGELWTAFAKRGMGSNATSPVNSTTAGLVENYDLPDDFSVTPAAGFAARGDAGGPFSVTSTACTLRNTGTASLNWTASSNAAWLTLSASAAALAGSAAATVTVSLNAAANALANGVYTGTVTVVNTTSGLAQARLFTLRVGVVDYFTELFDTSVNDTAFQSFTFTPNGSANFYRATRATAAAFSTDPAGGTPLAGHDTFNVITLTGGATVPFYGTSYGTLYVGSNGYVTFDSGDGGLTASVAAHFARKRIAGLMGHLNGNATAVSWRQLADRVAVTWLNVPEYSVVNSNSFQIEMFFDGRVRITTLGIGATGGLIGLSKGGGTPADFTESDFTGYAPDAFLTLTAPAQATEGAGTLVNAGQVTATPAPAANLTVTLASNRPADVTVPPTVTILAGQTSAQFPLTIGDNALLDGSRTAVLSASAAAFAAAQRPVIVNDDETGVLTVSAPVSATEGGPNLQGTVTVNTAVGADVFVALSSGNPAEVQVPVGVTILAGQTSAVFPITIIDDLRLDGAMATTITAQVTNWTPGSATINVLDNETASLTISAPAALREGDTAQTGTVRIGGSIATPLVVALSSNDPTEITVPATVTIPAGQTQAVFAITVIDDSADDGAQSVTLSATAAGFTGSPVVVSVADNDAHHFAMTPIASPVLRHAPVAVSVSARDVNGAIITNYNQTVAFTTNPASVPVTPASATGFVNGVLAVNLTFTAYGSGVVLAVADTGLHAGTSNAFDVTFGPAARFVWSPIASPRFVDELFPVTIRAVDAAGNSVPTFTGTASLAAPLPSKVEILTWTAYADISAAGEYVRTKQAISTFNTNYNETATNVTDAATLTTLLAGKHVFLIVEQEASSATTLGTIGTAWSAVLNSFVSSGGTVIVCSNTTSEHLLLTNSGLLNVTPIGSPNSVAVTKPADTPLNAGVAVPFTGSFLHSYSTTNGVVSLQTGKDPVVISRDVGAGRVVLIGTDFNALGTGMDRVIANAVGLAQPLGGGALPVNPSGTGAFVAGEWTGSVSVPYTGAGIVLRATAGALSGDSNALTVSAALPPSTLGTVFVEDFESGILNPAYWTITGTGGFRTINSAANGPHGGLRHMTMDEATDSGTYARNEATLAVNLAGRTGVLLKFWAIGYSEEADGPPPAPFPSTGANFDGVAISADGGVNWYEVQPLRTLSAAYAPYTVDLDAALAARGLTYGNNFKIRFNQYDNYAIATDGIGIDDILITAAVSPSALTLTIPAQATEGAGVLSGGVSVPTAPATDLVLTLASKSTAKVTVPATVTIPAGQTTVNFPLTVLDDPFLDGTKSVVITAVGVGFLETGATMQIIDNDAGVLALALPPTVLENAGTVPGTLSLSLPPLVPFTVALASSNPQAAQPPATVTIPRGAMSANFTVTIPDDTLIDGSQNVRLTATAAGWTNGIADLVVQDNELRILTVNIPASFRETDAPKTGTVSVGGTLAGDFVVTLTSSDTTEITVPASVTIPAGQTQAAFTVTVHDDTVADGAQPFTITASAATFTSGTAGGVVRDNEAHHFTFAPIGSPQVSNGPVPAIITARDPLDAVLTDYNSPVTFSATGSGGALPVTPATAGAFLNGVSVNSVQINALATNVVLTATAASGATGSSSAFDLATGSINRFVWDAVAAPQALDTPFAVTVRAVDAGGATVPAYHGIANLAVSVPVDNPAIGSNNTTVYPTLYTYYHDTRSGSLYTAGELGGAARITALAFNVTSLGSVAETLTNLTIRLKHTALANLGGVTTWDNAGWTMVYRASPVVSATGWVTFVFTTPFDYNGTGNLLVDISMDRAASNSSSTYLQGTSTSQLQTVYAVSNSTNGDPLTWTTAPAPSGYYQRADVRFTTLKDLPIRPALSGAFASGVWTGQVSVPVAGPALSLKARAGALSGASNSFDVNLPPLPPTGGATVLTEDFESGILNPAYWTITGTGGFRTINSAVNGPHGGLRHMTMDEATGSGTYARNEATLAVNLAGRTGVLLKFWAIGYSEEADGPPPAPFPSTGANFDGVAINADGGVNWYEVQPLRTLSAAYAPYTVDLDAALAARGLTYGSNFKIRFNQYDNYAIATDGIGIDDILITAAPLTGFVITAPAQVTEGAGAVGAVVTLNVAAATDTIIALTSSAPAKITVPASVQVPAGQTTASFTFMVLDDGIADGNRAVAITGSLAGQLPRAATVTVLDNDPLPLSIAAPATVAEGATGQTGTVTLGAAASGVITINLSSSDTTAVQVPASITLPAGQQSVAFPLTVVDDTRIDGAQLATLSASVPGWMDATTTVQVTDNETRTLALSGPYSVYEGATTSASVSISGTLPTDLVVTLTSANPAQLTVPASITIPAGLTSATFLATGVDDPLQDGTQTVVVTASAATFTSTTVSTTVYDNEVHHFTFTTVASSIVRGQPLTVTVSARDVNNATISVFTGSVNLAAAAGNTSVPMTPALSGTFSSGSWSGSVTIAGYGTGVAITASDAAGHTGTSNSFTVGAGALTALVWGTVPSPVTPGAPFATTLQARDAFGNTIPSFNGPVAVAAGPAQRTVGTGAVTVTQVLYTSASEARTQCIYLASELGAAGRLTGLALDVTALPGLPLTRFTVRVRPTALAAYASGAVWESTSWTTVFQANVTVSHTGWVMLPFSTPFAYDGTSNLMVDFSFDNVGSGTSGIVRASPATTTRMLYGSAFGASGDPLTWSGITPTVSLSSYLPNLRLRIERAVPITPATVTLASGAWTGALSLGGAGTGLTLTADATTGLTGESSAFDAVAAAALIVTPAGPASTSGFRGGPFTPLTHTFTVSNGGSGTMAWTASTATPWMSLSPGGGSLGAGASIAVTATLNAAALNALASGTHDGVIAFTNTTSGLGNTARTVTVSAVPAGDLVVTPPAALDASGPVGGPFAPSSQTYTLTNAGDVALNWTAGQTASWLTLSSAAGTLAPRASTTVTATILAPALKPGGYSDAVTFTNTSNHRGDTTRTATLNVILPAPILAFEPVFTGGTANSVTWSAVSAASEYEAEAADDVAFTSPVRSGWIAATSYTFTGLEDGRRYHYRVRARRVVPEQVGAWTQITQAEFDTGTKTGTVTVAPGSVVIGSALTWTENFDEPGTSFSSTIFSDIISSWNRLALSTSTYPATLPAIPINQGGDLEATGLGGAFMTDLPANRFTDGVIEGYLFPTQVNTFVALQLRAQRSPLQSYAAGISRDSATSGRVQIFVWGFGNVFGASPSFLMNGPNENFKLRFVASGSTLTVSLWRVAVSGGSVLETPVILENGVNSIVRTGASQTAGVAGIYALSAAGGTDLSACDDVAISIGGGGVYAASGTLTSQAIAPVPWQRWGALSFTSDTSAPGTALTVDVLNASGALLAANVAAGTDLSGIAAVASQASIRLRADLSTSNSANSPRLDGWSVTYATAPAQTTLSGWSETAVSAQDATAPAVTMTSPWATSTVLHTLAGTADDAGSISGVAGLTVNGVPVVSGDAFAHWSLPATLTLGVNTFSIVVWDKASPANERTFSHTVSVTPAAGDADGDGLPDAWEALYGLNTKDAKGANGALGDPDGDGRCTLLELALGTNPSVPDADGGNPPVLVRDAGDGQTYLTWRYRRLIAPGALSYIVETCTDFSEWHSGSAWIEEVGVPAPNPDGLTESVTIRALPPISSGPGYLRLRVTAP